MFGCIVLGEDNAFPIDLDVTKTIEHLKIAIKERAGLGDLAQNLTLWRVDIPESEKKELKKGIDTIKKNYSVEKLDGDLTIIGNIFKEPLSVGHIHIIAQPPPPATNSIDWSIITALDTKIVEKEVDEILNKYGQLFRSCCNENLKLPIFKPDEAHPYYNSIQDLQIPSNPKYLRRPFLLIHGLPTIDGGDGLTDTTVLENLSQIKECLLVLGTSGSGKTRTLIELLCRKYGFYFTGLTQENPGSGDLSMMINNIFSKLGDSLTHNDAYTMRYSKCLLFARVYILHHILKTYGKISPYNWTMLQLCPAFFFGVDIFVIITFKFREVPQNILSRDIWIFTHDILNDVKQKKLPVILDEAQELIDRFYNKFSSTTNKDESQPLYSLVTRAFAIQSLCVIPSGTDLTMKSVLDITGSHVMKGAAWNYEDLIVIKNGFDFDGLKNFLSKFRFPFDDHLDIMQWFVGRVGFVTTFVEEWLNNNYDIDELFTKFKESYTDPGSNKSIMVKIVNRTNKDTIRQGIRKSLLKEGACELDIMSLLEQAVLKIWYNGINAVIIKEEIALELFEYEIALLHKSDFSKLQISISEPLVIESALQYFKRYNDISLYILNQMDNMVFSPSSMGILWEKLIPDAITRLFQNEDALCIFEKPLPYNNWKIYKPPNGKLCVQAMHSTSDYKLPNYLENPGSPFFYPENTAGPDVLTTVCPVGSDKKYLVLIQAKFRDKNRGNVLLTTNPKKFYHTRPKKKGEKAELLKGQIYKESYEKVTKLIDENYDGIFRIFISYPATVTLQEEDEVEVDSTADIEIDEWTSIIDASNCHLIFDQHHINMFNELKPKQPKKREHDSQLDLNLSKKLKC